MSDRFAWLTETPLERSVAALSEGYCPKCGTRIAQGAPFDLDDEPTPDAPAFAQGGCLGCGLWMRAGHGGSNPERDWFAATMVNGDLDALMTLSLNPPSDPDDEYEDPDDWTDEEDG